MNGHRFLPRHSRRITGHDVGDKVKIIIKDVQDKRPVEDILWTDEDYQEGFKRAGLEVLKKYAPLAKENEPYEWINETRIAPWVIYVLKKAEKDLSKSTAFPHTPDDSSDSGQKGENKT